MEHRIEILKEKTLAGQRVGMSFMDNKTPALWRGFMPRRGEISGAIGTELYSAEVFPPGFFTRFDPAREFDKWAAVEVSAGYAVPEGMECLTVPGGMYAVFIYKGRPEAAAGFFQRIFTERLPAAGLMPDDRPHFAVMGEKYSNDSDDSEEAIWIPVRKME